MHPVARIQAAAMPSLYEEDTLSSPSGPQIHGFYVAPGYDILKPVEVAAPKRETIAVGAGLSLAKISPSVVVKYGSHASLIEAKTMCFIAQHTSLPVSKLYAAYAYGPLERDVDDFGSLYNTYIFMDFVEGETLEKAWDSYDGTTKLQIASELKGYIEQLRSIPAADYIGSVDRGPVTDMILEWTSSPKGPFDSEDDFQAAIAEAFVSLSQRYTASFTRGMLGSHKHNIVFTHGDFRPANIMVKDGHVAAILDWELSGWYPEHWEFVKALYTERYAADWPTHLLEILRPYYCEQAIHSMMARLLW